MMASPARDGHASPRALPARPAQSDAARLKALRARCEARLRSLNLPDRLTLDALQAAVEAQRGRPIVLEPFPFAARGSELSGLTMTFRHVDLVFYERDTSPPHQWAIRLHEFAHLLCGSPCGHLSAQANDVAFLRELVSSLFSPEDFQPDAVLSALSRTTYDSEDEQEVEVLASLLLPRLAPTQHPAAPLTPEARELLARLRAALEEQQRTAGDPQ